VAGSFAMPMLPMVTDADDGCSDMTDLKTGAFQSTGERNIYPLTQCTFEPVL